MSLPCPLQAAPLPFVRSALLRATATTTSRDPRADERCQFKEISIAYQVLSDPELRHKYNEFGQKNGGGMAEPAGGFQDPEEVFGKMFGGDKFDLLIGQISIGEPSRARRPTRLYRPYSSV